MARAGDSSQVRSVVEPARGSQEPLIHVGTPTAGKIHACNANQSPMMAKMAKNSTMLAPVLVVMGWCLVAGGRVSGG